LNLIRVRPAKEGGMLVVLCCRPCVGGFFVVHAAL